MKINYGVTLASIALLSLGVMTGCAKTETTEPTDGSATEQTAPGATTEQPAEGQAPDAAK